MFKTYGIYWRYDVDDEIDPEIRLPTLRGRLQRQVYRGENGTENTCGWLVERRRTEIGAYRDLVESGISYTVEIAKRECEAALLRHLTAHEKIALAKKALR